MYPDDPRSPFFNENGDEMAPLARLHLNRINLIPKSCSDKIITELMDELVVSENTQDISRRKYFVFYLFFFFGLLNKKKLNYIMPMDQNITLDCVLYIFG